MTIRKATLQDIPAIMEIFAIARRFMAATGNPNQWPDTYPSTEQLTDDIDSGDSYICIENGSMVVTFVLRGGNDPTYSTIRIDTHRDNRVMQTIVAKAGFSYCGIIHCWNGEERLAYQYSKSPSKTQADAVN